MTPCSNCGEWGVIILIGVSEITCGICDGYGWKGNLIDRMPKDVFQDYGGEA